MTEDEYKRLQQRFSDFKAELAARTGEKARKQLRRELECKYNLTAQETAPEITIYLQPDPTALPGPGEPFNLEVNAINNGAGGRGGGV